MCMFYLHIGKDLNIFLPHHLTIFHTFLCTRLNNSICKQYCVYKYRNSDKGSSYHCCNCNISLTVIKRRIKSYRNLNCLFYSICSSCKGSYLCLVQKSRKRCISHVLYNNSIYSCFFKCNRILNCTVNNSLIIPIKSSCCRKRKTMHHSDYCL